jgi:hypothetical protein
MKHQRTCNRNLLQKIEWLLITIWRFAFVYMAVWLYHFWKIYCPFSLRILHQKDDILNSVIQHFTQHLSPRMANINITCLRVTVWCVFFCFFNDSSQYSPRFLCRLTAFIKLLYGLNWHKTNVFPTSHNNNYIQKKTHHTVTLKHVIFILAILTVCHGKKPVRIYHMETLHMWYLFLCKSMKNLLLNVL